MTDELRAVNVARIRARMEARVRRAARGPRGTVKPLSQAVAGLTEDEVDLITLLVEVGRLQEERDAARRVFTPT